MPTYPITESVALSGNFCPVPAAQEDVQRRLPEGIRWSPATREIVSDGTPPEELRPMTGADIDWSGLDQELAEETSFTVAVEILIEEVAAAWVERGRGESVSVAGIATALGVRPRTVHGWVERFPDLAALATETPLGRVYDLGAVLEWRTGLMLEAGRPKSG